jgi:hypothetical protein
VVIGISGRQIQNAPDGQGILRELGEQRERRCGPRQYLAFLLVLGGCYCRCSRVRVCSELLESGAACGQPRADLATRSTRL